MIKLLLRSLDSLYTQHLKQTRLYLSLKVDGCRGEPGGWARRALARLGVPRARPSQGGLSSQAVRSVSCSPATPRCWLLHGAWRRECALAPGAVTVRSLASDARARPGRPRGACGPSEWLSFLSLRAPVTSPSWTGRLSTLKGFLWKPPPPRPGRRLRRMLAAKAVWTCVFIRPRSRPGVRSRVRTAVSA